MDFFLNYIKKQQINNITINNNKKLLRNYINEVLDNISKTLNIDIKEYIGELSLEVADLSKKNAIGLIKPKIFKKNSTTINLVKAKIYKKHEIENTIRIDKSILEIKETNPEYKNIIISTLSHEITHHLDYINQITKKVEEIKNEKAEDIYYYKYSNKEISSNNHFENFKNQTLEDIKTYPVSSASYYMSDVELLARYIQSSSNLVNNIDTGRQLIPGSSFIKNNPQVIPYFKKQEEESKTQEKEELKKTDNKLEKTIDKPKLQKVKKSPPKPKKIPKKDNKTKPKNYGSHIIQPYEILNQYEKKYGPIDSLSKLTWAIVRISKEKKLPHKEILEMVDNLNPYKPIDNKKSYNLKSFGIFKGSFQDVFNIIAKWGVLNKNKNTIKQTFIKYSTQIEIKEKEEQGLKAKWGPSISPDKTQRSLHRRFIGIEIGNRILKGKIPGEEFNCRCSVYFI